jgi:mannose-6-phosphate isomerase class I
LHDETASAAPDPVALELLASAAPALLIPERNNFVERPWGGLRMRAHKGLCALPDQAVIGGAGLGEAFELAAWEQDAEARAHPSYVRLGASQRVALGDLLQAQPQRILGEAFVQRFGSGFPLLPKTLDIKELLSVQGHPSGHTEAYIVIDAEPGATIRLGFARDVEPAQFAAQLRAGRCEQQRLLACFGPGLEQRHLHALLSPWFAAREVAVETLRASVGDGLDLREPWPEFAPRLIRLKQLYWQVLDALNAIPVAAGQVIHNATPARVLAATGRPAAAEVHALGNPEGKEILLLEIRRPGPTLRAWDNVRFPMRPLDIDAAMGQLNPGHTAPEEFIVVPQPVAGEPGIRRSVDSPFFRIEHLHPEPDRVLVVRGGWPHGLHVIRGSATVEIDRPRPARYALTRGDSALVSAEVGRYRVSSAEAGTEIVKAELPPRG